MRDLANEAQGLRRDLQNAGLSSRELTSIDDTLRALREMDSVKLTEDPRALQALTAAALEKLKRFDLDLRKRLDTTSNQLFLAGAEDVPKSYQPLVNEYQPRALQEVGWRGNAATGDEQGRQVGDRVRRVPWVRRVPGYDRCSGATGTGCDRSRRVLVEVRRVASGTVGTNRYDRRLRTGTRPRPAAPAYPWHLGAPDVPEAPEAPVGTCRTRRTQVP